MKSESYAELWRFVTTMTRMVSSLYASFNGLQRVYITSLHSLHPVNKQTEMLSNRNVSLFSKISFSFTSRSRQSAIRLPSARRGVHDFADERGATVLHHCRRSCFDWLNLNSHRRMHRRARKISRRASSPAHPGAQNPPRHPAIPMNSSSRVSLLALLVFPCACYYAVIRARLGCRTCGAHSGPRAITNNLYITGDLSACQNSSQNRLRPEQSARTDDNAAKRRRTLY